MYERVLKSRQVVRGKAKVFEIQDNHTGLK